MSLYDPEFYAPFEVTDTGIIQRDEYVPEVYTCEQEDGSWTDAVIGSGDWEFASTGYTQQYGCSGPNMHSSEQFSGALKEDVMNTPGVYVLVPVESVPFNTEDEAPAESWAVLKKK